MSDADGSPSRETHEVDGSETPETPSVSTDEAIADESVNEVATALPVVPAETAETVEIAADVPAEVSLFVEPVYADSVPEEAAANEVTTVIPVVPAETAGTAGTAAEVPAEVSLFVKPVFDSVAEESVPSESVAEEVAANEVTTVIPVVPAETAGTAGTAAEVPAEVSLFVEPVYADSVPEEAAANEVTTVIPVVPAETAETAETAAEISAEESVGADSVSEESVGEESVPSESVPEEVSANEVTTVIPVVPAQSAETFETASAEVVPPAEVVPEFEPVIREPESVPVTERAAHSRKWVKPAVVVGGILAVGVLAYGVDVFTSSGNTPRGTQVAGIDIGNRSPEDAELVLRSELGPRLVRAAGVSADGTESAIVPASAGIDVDWSATLAGVNEQPLNPITRITSFFTSREVPVVSTVDQGALDLSLAEVAAASDRAPVEGALTIAEGQATGVSPVVGRALDVPGAGAAFTDEWADGGVVVLPVTDIPVTVTQSGVDRALKDFAQPAVSADVVVNGRDGKEATLVAGRIGEVLTFVPDGSGGLTPQYNTDAAVKILAPQLVSTEVQPKDASIRLAGGAPTVVPGVVGDLINWPDTVKDLPALLSSTGSRATPAVYGPVPPALTTEGAEALGIREVIGEYTTGGFAYASGVNIALAASTIDGALVKPGETFSFNDFTGPRGAAQGYVESGIINNGRPDNAVGGGISQLATTLYNATYFAGMEDVAHTEHSYYISRYPAAREATIFDGAIDLQFRNPAKTGVMIETITTSSQVTVRIWGTKTVDVESSAGPRTSPTSPNTVVLPKGDECVASSGAPGFTTSDTRVISDHATGAQISSNTRTVKYDPVPIVKCE